MIVQHNIMAINSHRQLGINNTNLSKNLEKLSSGYRINRAADDAAGLAISEKMRAQITGLNRAVMNAQDGASLIQTAEGALQEVHGMLNRMVELATQSANGTIQASDRQKIEAETQALLEEIDRISQSTNFNGIKLLDGSLATASPQSITVTGPMVDKYAAMPGIYNFGAVGDVADTLNPTLDGMNIGDKFEYTVGLNNGESVTVTLTVSDNGKYLTAEDGTVYELATAATATGGVGEVDSEVLGKALVSEFRKTGLDNDFIIGLDDSVATGDGLTFKSIVAGTKSPQVTSFSVSKNNASAAQIAQGAKVLAMDPATNTVATDEVRAIATASFTVFNVPGDGTTNESQATFTINGEKFILVNRDDASDDYATFLADLENRGVHIIQIDGEYGDAISPDDMTRISATVNQKTGLATYVDSDYGLVLKGKEGTGGLTMQVGDTADAWNKITVSVDNMSAAGLGISNISMATQESSANALAKINAAIEKVSVNRGNLGALQNRLEYTINNLNVASENMTAAESRIRDVDMAKEMMQFTKNNVLSQAAQAMLAQANMQPQNVLQLLR